MIERPISELVFNIHRNEAAELVVQRLMDSVVPPTISATLQKGLDILKRSVMKRLMKEPIQFAKHLMDKQQVSERHGNGSIPWYSVQAELDDLKGGWR
jgi:hypothetical protein